MLILALACLVFAGGMLFTYWKVCNSNLRMENRKPIKFVDWLSRNDSGQKNTSQNPVLEGSLGVFLIILLIIGLFVGISLETDGQQVVDKSTQKK